MKIIVNTNKKILLTMGMPVYNEEKYIGEAIESLLAQTYRDFVLIISDNASTDKTPEICKYYAEKDSRITYIRHSKNKGALFNFKCVLDMAETPFFMWCSGHDKWHPEFIEKLLPIIEREDIVLIYPNKMRIEMNGNLVHAIDEVDPSPLSSDNISNRYLYILKKNIEYSKIHGIWRTEVLKKCYFRIIYSPDKIILVQAALEGKIKRYNEKLFFKRIVRIEKSSRESLIRSVSDVSGKDRKVSLISFFKIKLLMEILRVLFRKRYPLKMFSRIWLSIHTVYFVLFHSSFLKNLIKDFLNLLSIYKAR